MKQNSLAGKIWITAVILGVLAYFGVQIFRYADDPLSTALAYTYQVEDTVELTGYVVRQETVLEEGAGGLTRLLRQEGERVSAGGAVAAVYADEATLARQEEADSLRSRISQLEYAQESMLGAEVTLKLDGQISAALLDYRAQLAAGRLDAAESSGQELRSLVLKRDYSYSGTEDLSAQLEELRTQLRQLESQSARSVRTIRSGRSGLFSGVVDGYESVLTPESLSGLTPSALESLTPADTAGVGRLILGDSWYYAAAVSAQEAQTLQEGASRLRTGESLYLRFSKGVNRDLAVTLESVGPEENGRCVVVLRGSSYLQELTLLRRQSAEVILSVTGGIRVPRAALRVGQETEAVKDETSGAESEKTVSVTGVYCISGAKARFKPVEVLYVGEEYAIVTPTAQGEKLKLRPGDEVIVTARNLYDGKVVS